MSAILSDKMIKSIVVIFAKYEVEDRLFLFDKIPPTKLKNARISFASNMGSDEKVIALHDDTVMGSAKNGFVLTTKRLYHKESFGRVAFVEIDRIVDLKFRLGKNASEVDVVATSGIIKVKILLSKNHEAIFNALREAILLLQNPNAPTQTSNSTDSTHCNGCGAVGPWAVCEYCGSPMQ